ncbi:hypothetical protein COLO4_34987 [Corchorus olitorius]|uniref:Uncharacterized protein n=1 Tax=Corchorus olitorius TaxID=93759 RepID=A0A1R3GIL7_9ROSI|nr:hypothetical protein COLO4_34987 [Corchorus olitorius]
MELFIGPAKHQPFDPDGTIPSNHLRNFEHSSISMTFFTYAAFAILLDKINPKAKFGLTQFLGAIAFSQQLLVFHLHSTDHMGVEVTFYLVLGKLHGRKLEYSTLTKEEDLELEDNNYIDDLESKKETKRMGKGYAVLDSQK